MKKLFVIFTLISILSLSFYSILRADIFRGKAGAMFNKNGMKEKIIDSTTKIPEAVTFSSPASGEVIYINSVTVKGTVTGRIDSVSVLLDSGAWQTASGVATWQYVFSGLTNGTHTVKAKAINSKGTGPEATRTFTVDCTPQVSIIAGPSSSLSTNQTFVVTLSADRDHGYWSTNGSTFYEFNTGTTNISIDRSMVLRFYGKGITSHTSATQIRNYTIDLTPYVSIVSGPTASFLSTNNTFNIRLSVTKNSGYWSTNGSIFHSFPKGTTNLPIVSTTTLRYYGNDGLSHISSTQKKIYVLDLSPRITISSGPTNSTVETNHSFSIQLSADKSFGYWSTNGSIFNSFPAGTANLSIISTTTLRYYGNDGTHTSATQKKIYIINDAPKVTIVTGPSHDLTTNQPFIVKLRVNTNSGYWSTNNSGFYSFPKGTTNLSIISTTTLRYFGFNGIHTSLTQKRVYILDYIAPHVTIISGPSNSYNTNAGCSVTLSADENYGYWSTNGSTYISFPFGTKTFAITKNTKLKYYGRDNVGNQSTITSNIYIIDTIAPHVTIISGPTNNLSTNQPFSVRLSVDENSGYWSTNGSNFNSFPAGTTNLKIVNSGTLKYFGKDKWGNTSSTQTKTFIVTNYYGIYTETHLPQFNYDTVKAYSDPLAAIQGTWGGAALSANTSDVIDGLESLQANITSAGGIYIKYGTFTNSALWNSGHDTPHWTNQNLVAYSNGSVEFDLKSNSKDFWIKIEYGLGSPVFEKRVFTTILAIAPDNAWHHISIPITPANGFTSTALKKMSVPFGWYANASYPVTVLIDNIYYKFP